MPSLPYWLFPGDDRPPGEIDDEITEELQLHLDLMAEEQMRQGVGPEDARRQAAERFGDFNSLVRRCRVEKQGDAPMLKRVQAGLTALLLAAVVWLGVRDYFSAMTTARYMDQTTNFLSTIQSDLGELRGQLQSADSAEGETGKSIRLLVVDDSGTQIAGAKLVISWKDFDRNWVDSYVVSTDSDGRYDARLTDPAQRIESVTAYAEGYAFASSNLLRPSLGDPAEPFVLRLEKSVERRVRLVDETGEPITGKRVSPSKRIDSQGVHHSIVGGAIPGLARTTDDDGYCTIDWFEAGDEASLYFLFGKEGRDASFVVPPKSDETLTARTSPKANGNYLGSGGGAF